VDIETVATPIERDTAVKIINVRISAEFEAAHIPGSYNVPLDLLPEHRAAPLRRGRQRWGLERSSSPGRWAARSPGGC